MYTDKTLVCKGCNKEFVLTGEQQQWFADRGLHEPGRCEDCRAERRKASGNTATRQFFDATCSNCGKVASVPFKPVDGRPVFCKDCFRPSK